MGNTEAPVLGFNPNSMAVLCLVGRTMATRGRLPGFELQL
jgi:hypothetical protein